MAEKMQIQEATNKEAIKNTIDPKAEKQFEDLLTDISKEENKALDVADAFTDHGDEVLDAIKASLTKLTTEINENETENKDKYNNYKLATQAFNEDITKAQENLKLEEEKIINNKKTTKPNTGDPIYDSPTENTWWRLNKYEKEEDQLNNLLQIVADINMTIPWVKEEQEKKQEETKKQKKTENFELQKEKYLNVNEKTPQNVKKFFEEDRETYNAILDDIFEKQGWTDKIIINSNSKGDANSLYLRVQKYTRIENLWDITIWKADKFDWTNWTKNRFNNNERIIQYTVPAYTNEKWEEIEKKTKFIAQGTQQEMQNRIAENAVENWFIPNTIDRTETYRKDENGKVTEKWTEEKPENIKEVPASLNIFDDVGNFEAFKIFLNNQQNANTITSNIRSIITQIMNYEASSDTADASENPNDLKNWYANVFTEYMMKQSNPVTLQIYVSYITKENLNLLWVDEATRINNYNRFFFSDPKNSKLRPEIETMLNNMNEDEKKIIIENIAQTRIAITNEKSWWTVENIKQWFDAFIDAFGPMLFNILWFLWVSKATLLKWFPGAAEKINEKFAEEYGLNDNQLEALWKITSTFPKEPIDQKKYGDMRKGDNLKKVYTDKIDGKYKELINQNYEHINVNVFSKWVDLYNKKTYKNDTAKYVNINDIINTKTENEKEYITSPKDEAMYETIIETIVNDNSTRSRIANANVEIQTEATYKEKWLSMNKQWLDWADGSRYLIRSENDIVRYLTASLFSDKDLAYVMTENKLHNWMPIITNTTETTETLSFNPDDVKDWVITTTGETKKIHEIFTDYAKAPEILLFTPKGENTAKEIKKAKVDIDWTETETYVDSDWKMIEIQEWDTITLPEKQTQATLVDMRTGIQEELKKQTTTKETFEWDSYKLDNTNIYQQQIAKVSDLFTGENYKNLLEESEQKTLKSIIETNTGDFKNMLVYRWLKQTEDKDAIYKTDKMTLDQNVLANIDPTKQTLKVSEVKDGNITIEVAKKDATNDTKEGTIILTKDATTGKLETKRTEKKEVA